MASPPPTFGNDVQAYTSHLLPDRRVEIRAAVSDALKAKNSFVIDDDVSGIGVNIERLLNASIVVAILRPDHPVPLSKLPPSWFVVIGANPNQHE